jgi:hypothetical protein
MGFSKNVKYYSGTVFEWNLPVGHSCPYALECLVKVDRVTGKQDNRSSAFKCYASSAERFPGVRESRWKNFDVGRRLELPELPKTATAVRVHASGDFFSQDYFDTWLDYARARPDVAFWAFTKSINFWVERLDRVPSNFVLTASLGGKLDDLALQHNLRTATVVPTLEDANGKPVDYNDDLARVHGESFVLLDNANVSKPSPSASKTVSKIRCG